MNVAWDSKPPKSADSLGNLDGKNLLVPLGEKISRNLSNGWSVIVVVVMFYRKKVCISTNSSESYSKLSGQDLNEHNGRAPSSSPTTDRFCDSTSVG